MVNLFVKKSPQYKNSYIAIVIWEWNQVDGAISF